MSARDEMAKKIIELARLEKEAIEKCQAALEAGNPDLGKCWLKLAKHYRDDGLQLKSYFS